MNAGTIFLALSMLLVGGCWSSCDVSAHSDTETESAPQIPPSVDDIIVPSYPPLGPDGVIRAKVSDDCCLAEVDFTFAERVVVPISGTQAEVEIAAADLGEGIGTLYVDALDTEYLWATREVEQLLIDLSPPTAEIGSTVVPAEDGQIEIWVGDAWVLGSVELSFKGVTQKRAFPPAYPATLGEEWDHSLEIFPASAFPAGSGTATLTVIDAAGNSMVETFPLVIDASPPDVSIAQPASGSTVSGVFEVSIDAADAEGPTTIDLYAAGSLIATAVGPHATIAVDTSAFLPGPLDLEAVAVDAAGNRSAKATVSIVIEAPPSL